MVAALVERVSTSANVEMGIHVLCKKPPDFIHNEFIAEIPSKCMEICSQKLITFF